MVGMDTPRFYIMQGKDEEAKKAISKIYNTDGDAKKVENIYLAEKAACTVGDDEDVGAKVTTKMALWTDERYVRSSWTAIGIMAFQCLTGYYAIIAYSEVLLREDFGEGPGLTTRDGVFIIQAFNLMGSFTSIYFVSVVGRRTIFLIGQAGIAVCLCGIAIVSIFESPVTLLVLFCIISFLF